MIILAKSSKINSKNGGVRCVLQKEGYEGVCIFLISFFLAVPGILNSKPRYAERLIHPPEFSKGSHSHFHATIRGGSSGHLDSSTKSEWLGYIDLQGYCNGIHAVDNYAYVCDSRLWIIDVSDPYNPFEAGHYTFPGYAYGSISRESGAGDLQRSGAEGEDAG